MTAQVKLRDEDGLSAPALAALAAGVLLAVALCPRFSASSNPRVGTPAPAFTLEVVHNGEAGARLDLSSLQGRPVILDFWATWCGPCRMEAPILERVAQRYKDRGLVVVGVNTADAPGRAGPVAAKLGLSYPIVFDAGKDVGDAYGVESLPTLVIVGRDGQVKAVRTGLVDEASLEALIAQSLLVDPVDVRDGARKGPLPLHDEGAGFVRRRHSAAEWLRRPVRGRLERNVRAIPRLVGGHSGGRRRDLERLGRGPRRLRQGLLSRIAGTGTVGWIAQRGRGPTVGIRRQVRDFGRAPRITRARSVGDLGAGDVGAGRHPGTRRPKRSDTTARMRNPTKRILPMPAALAAMPLKPKNAAMRAITKKATVQRSMVGSFLRVCLSERGMTGSAGSRLLVRQGFCRYRAGRGSRARRPGRRRNLLRFARFYSVGVAIRLCARERATPLSAATSACDRRRTYLAVPTRRRRGFRRGSRGGWRC